MSTKDLAFDPRNKFERDNRNRISKCLSEWSLITSSNLPTVTVNETKMFEGIKKPHIVERLRKSLTHHIANTERDWSYLLIAVSLNQEGDYIYTYEAGIVPDTTGEEMKTISSSIKKAFFTGYVGLLGHVTVLSPNTDIDWSKSAEVILDLQIGDGMLGDKVDGQRLVSLAIKEREGGDVC